MTTNPLAKGMCIHIDL